jgi:hypothetical protein
VFVKFLPELFALAFALATFGFEFVGKCISPPLQAVKVVSYHRDLRGNVGRQRGRLLTDVLLDSYITAMAFAI